MPHSAQCAIISQQVVCLCLSVCLSVRDAQVWFSHRLEYFENNFMADNLRHLLILYPNMGDLVQREHPKIKME